MSSSRPGSWLRIFKVAPKKPLVNLKSHVARKHATRSSYFDRSGSRARRHHSFNIAVGFDFERSRRPIKADARRARQIVPQNDQRLPGAAKARIRFHERAQSHRQTVDGAAAAAPAVRAGPSIRHRAIKNPVGRLYEPSLWTTSVSTVRLRAKAMQRRQLSR